MRGKKGDGDRNGGTGFVDGVCPELPIIDRTDGRNDENGKLPKYPAEESASVPAEVVHGDLALGEFLGEDEWWRGILRGVGLLRREGVVCLPADNFSKCSCVDAVEPGNVNEQLININYIYLH